VALIRKSGELRTFILAVAIHSHFPYRGLKVQKGDYLERLVFLITQPGT
jgi:hypothetical protein